MSRMKMSEWEPFGSNDGIRMAGLSSREDVHIYPNSIVNGWHELTVIGWAENGRAIFEYSCPSKHLEFLKELAEEKLEYMRSIIARLKETKL